MMLKTCILSFANAVQCIGEYTTVSLLVNAGATVLAVYAAYEIYKG